MRKTWMLILTLLLATFVLAACGDDNEAEDGSNEENDNGQEEVNDELPEPDLEDIPDVVAEINGDEITGEEFEMNYEQQFQEAAMQSQMAGEEVDEDQIKNQIAEGMISQELLTQEADNRISEVSDEDFNETMDLIVEQNGLESEDELIEGFEEQGTDEEELMAMIEAEVKIDQLIADESGDIEPTDEELEETYEMYEAQQEQMGSEEELPSFDEMKPDLEEEVKSQKEMEVAQNLVDQLREEADVTIHL